MKKNTKKFIAFVSILILFILSISIFRGINKSNVVKYTSDFQFETNQFDLSVVDSAPQKLLSIKNYGNTSKMVVRGKDSYNDYKNTKFSKDKSRLSKYLQKTDFIDFENERIVILSNTLGLSELSPQECAKSVLKAINQNTGLIKYDKILASEISSGSSYGRSASETLRTSMGTCGEFANVFIALMRLNGIPCKYIYGMCLTPEIRTLHAWAEFYDEKQGWIPVDPQVGTIGVLSYYIKLLEGKDFLDTGVDFSKLLFGNFLVLNTSDM